MTRFFSKTWILFIIDDLVDDFCSIHGSLDGLAIFVNEILKST